MKLIRGYYAYLAIAGGLLLGLVLQNNWMLQIVAYALISAGALSLQQVSRWFLRASITADVCIGFEVVCGPAVVPPGLFRMVLEYASLVPLLMVGCMLLMAFMAQMRDAGRGTGIEWVIFVVWSAGFILTLLMAPGWLNDMALSLTMTAVNTLTVLGYIALLADTFRAQKEYIRTEGEKP
ncbi:hypothetical protein [Candidatus Agathobaculum pullicola]|uniref:hypothetical protein n=1 Tax=Candidatus Agathobaculum pullicola TaxID=2838426 RepID=UPI003F8F4F40